MMKYTNRYWNMLMPYIKKSLRKRYGKEETQKLIVKADGQYREMLNRIDDVGADNPMASNIYECLIFFAVYEAADGKLSVDDLQHIVEEVMTAPILKLAGLFVNGNKKSGIRRMYKMMVKDAKWLDEHPQYKAASWDFNFDETKHKDGFYYYFTQCPLNTFARREGYLDVLPVMCANDHLMAGLMHMTLHREQTLASGGSICDYWFYGDQIKNPQ